MFLKKIKLITLFLSLSVSANDSFFYFQPDLTMRIAEKDVKITRTMLRSIIEKENMKKALDNFLGIDSVKLIAIAKKDSISYFDYKNLINANKLPLVLKKLKAKQLSNCNYTEFDSNEVNELDNVEIEHFPLENQILITDENLKKGINDSSQLKILLNSIGKETSNETMPIDSIGKKEIQKSAEFIRLKNKLKNEPLSRSEANVMVQYLKRIQDIEKLAKHVTPDKALIMRNFIAISDEEKMKALSSREALTKTILVTIGVYILYKNAERVVDVTKSIVGTICGKERRGELDDFEEPRLPDTFPPIKDPDLGPQRPVKGI